MSRELERKPAGGRRATCADAREVKPGRAKLLRLLAACLLVSG